MRSVTLTLLASLLVGCGGGGSSPSAPTPTPPSSPNAGPTAPVLVELSSLQVGQVSASWLPSTDDTTAPDRIRYQVHASTDPAFVPASETLKFEGAGVASAAIASGWTPGARFVVKVVALDAQGLSSTSGPLTVVVSDTQATPANGAAVRRLEATDVASATPNTVTLNPSVPAVAVGQYIASAEGSGLLRQITGVASNVVTTSPAALGQVLSKVTVGAAVRLTSTPTTIPLAANSQARRTIVASETADRTEINWPESQFRLSTTSTPGSGSRRRLSAAPQATGTSGPAIAASPSSLTIDTSSKLAEGGIGRYSTVEAPDTVGIVTNTRGIFGVKVDVVRNPSEGGVTKQVVICEMKIVDNPFPIGVAGVGEVTDAVRSEFIVRGAPFSGLKAGTYPVLLDMERVAARAEPYRLKLRMRVDEALNGCADRSFFGSLLGWSDEVTVEVKVVVTSTPSFPNAESRRLTFSGGASLSVSNNVTFTLDPTLEAEVSIDGSRLQMARLEAKGRMEVRQELNVVASASGRVESTQQLIGERKFVKVFMAGAVPIVMSGAFTVDIRVEGEATGALNVNEVLSFSLEDLLYGVRYEGGAWTTPKAIRPVHRFTLLGEGEAKANLRVSLLPRLSVSFYEALTGRLVLAPYLDADAGVKGRVAIEAVVDSVTADADWWISAGRVSGGVDAFVMADFSVFDRVLAAWPAGADPDRDDTWRKFVLWEPVPILGIPTLSATVDPNAKHPADSRAILIRGSATNVPNPFKTLFGGPDAFLEFRSWTAPVVVAAGGVGYRSIPNPPASAAGDHWIVFDRAGAYKVRLGAVSSLGGWARQIAEADVGLVDANANGLPDYWEAKFGLAGSPAAIASGDPDGDGNSNLDEWRLGTDPTVRNEAGGTTINRVQAFEDGVVVDVPNGGATPDRRPRFFGELARPLKAGEALVLLDGFVARPEVPVVSGVSWSLNTLSEHSFGEHSFAVAILDRNGSVVGLSERWRIATVSGRPVFWRAKWLPLPAEADYGIASSINQDSNLVVGTAGRFGVANTTRVVVWAGDLLQTVLPNPAGRTKPNAPKIDSSGRIYASFEAADGQSDTFAWSGTSWEWIAADNVLTPRFIASNRGNRTDVLVGAVFDSTLARRAAVSDSSGVRPLPQPESVVTSSAFDVNSDGVIVGFASTADCSGAVRWKELRFEWLGRSDGQCLSGSSAQAVSPQGVVAGFVAGIHGTEVGYWSGQETFVDFGVVFGNVIGISANRDLLVSVSGRGAAFARTAGLLYLSTANDLGLTVFPQGFNENGAVVGVVLAEPGQRPVVLLPLR